MRNENIIYDMLQRDSNSIKIYMVCYNQRYILHIFPIKIINDQF